MRSSSQFESIDLADSDLRLADVLTTEEERLVENLKGRSAATQRSIFQRFSRCVWGCLG